MRYFGTRETLGAETKRAETKEEEHKDTGKAKQEASNRWSNLPGCLVLLALATLIGYGAYVLFLKQSPAMELHQLVDAIRADQVQVLAFHSKGPIDVELKDGTHATCAGALGLVPELEAAYLLSKGIRVKVHPETSWAWLELVILTLGLLGVCLVLGFQSRGADRSSASGFTADQSRQYQRAQHRPVTFADIAGLHEAKQECQRLIKYFKDPGPFIKIGVQPPKGFIFEGPPGMGKTLLARALAHESHVSFFSLSASELDELYVGVGAARLRSLFATARANTPCVVFIDELDAVGQKRAPVAGVSTAERDSDRTLNQLLACLDGLEPIENIVVIAATNRCDVLDPALTRPGRFDNVIHVELGSLDDRRTLVDLATRALRLAPQVQLQELATAMQQFSGAEITAVCNRAALLAADDNAEEIAEHHFAAALTWMHRQRQDDSSLDKILHQSRTSVVFAKERCDVTIDLFQKGTRHGRLIWMSPDFIKIDVSLVEGDTDVLLIPRTNLLSLRSGAAPWDPTTGPVPRRSEPGDPWRAPRTVQGPPQVPQNSDSGGIASHAGEARGKVGEGSIAPGEHSPAVLQGAVPVSQSPAPECAHPEDIFPPKPTEDAGTGEAAVEHTPAETQQAVGAGAEQRSPSDSPENPSVESGCTPAADWSCTAQEEPTHPNNSTGDPSKTSQAPRSRSAAFADITALPDAKALLASLGIESGEELQAAVAGAAQARQRLAPDSPPYGWLLMAEGQARLILAQLGIEPGENLQRAVALLAQARERLAPDSPDYGRVQMHEGIVRTRLAELGIEPVENLHAAIALLAQARQGFPHDSSDYGQAQGTEGAARLWLAELGVEPVENLQRAVVVLAQARERLAPDSPDYGGTLCNEATARMRLEQWGVEPVENLQRAIALYAQARQQLSADGPAYGSVLLNEGNARQLAAQFGVEPSANLQRAATLYAQARQRLSADSLDYGRALLNEGNAWGRLAEFGVEREKNLRRALQLAQEAEERFEPGSIEWSLARCNQAPTLRQLGQVEEAYRRLREALEGLEGVRAQLRREHERIAFMENIARQYETMVAVCLDLASRAAPGEQTEWWCWEAWHWVHRGKSRTLRELLATVRPRLTEDERALWEEFEHL